MGRHDPSRFARGTVRRLAAAAAAGLVVVALPAAAQDSELGRLFYTPQQRAELDKRRVSNVPAQTEAAPVVQQPDVTLNGYVGRSSGKTTTWVNGVPKYDTVRSQDPSRLSIDAGDGRRSMKVGATLNTSRGEVRDVLGDGQIRINSQP
jgi:hypothetical protein